MPESDIEPLNDSPQLFEPDLCRDCGGQYRSTDRPHRCRYDETPLAPWTSDLADEIYDRLRQTRRFDSPDR